MNWFSSSRMSTLNNLRETFETTHPEVWGNDGYRDMVVNILVCIGTNLLLDEHITAGNGLLAYHFIMAIVVMENYNEEVHTSFDLLLKSRIVASKMRDIMDFSSSTARRDVLKFYRKRTTCSCLKDMHLEARKILPKLGLVSIVERRRNVRHFLSVVDAELLITAQWSVILQVGPSTSVLVINMPTLINRQRIVMIAKWT